MKVKTISLIILIFLSFALISCNQGTNIKEEISEVSFDLNNKGKLKVYTSFYPMYDFAKKIGGNKIELRNLLPSGEEVHHWEPTPTDIVDLESANLFIYSGIGMEHWVEKVIPTIKNTELAVLEASTGIELLKSINEENHDDEEDDHEHADYDPHIWLSLNSAKQQLRNIANSLISIDKDNADYYESNYLKYSKEFDDLYNNYKDVFKNNKNKTIIVSHEAYGYLTNEFGLSQIGISGIIPNSEPEPKKLAEIIKLVKELNVSTIFYEELLGTKIADTIAKETGATISELSTIETISNKDLKAGEDYLSIMKRNLEAIKAALK